jgi:hypothetical protein
MRCSIIALLAALSGALFGQTRAGEPIMTTLCELVRDPERFNNKVVEIRSEFVSRFQWEGFLDETCSAKIQVSAYGVFEDSRAQEVKEYPGFQFFQALWPNPPRHPGQTRFTPPLISGLAKFGVRIRVRT